MDASIQSIQASNTDDFLERIDLLSIPDTHQQIFISRYPATALVDRLDISKIRCYWLTLSQDTGSLEPSLEKINHLIQSTISESEGSIFVEGIEWLASLHGFDAVHSMIRSLAEKVSMTNWSIYLSISQDSFTQLECSRLYREAPVMVLQEAFSKPNHEQLVPNDAVTTLHQSVLEMDLNEDGTPKLVMLTRLPQTGFTKQILQRRILQWRRMGLDTSEIEYTLYSDDETEMYHRYVAVEENVRRATELERYIIAHVQDTQEKTIALFRIRQLTGLDELEYMYFSN
jgi:hypothetical protein